jgi:hypothetical protein
MKADRSSDPMEDASQLSAKGETVASAAGSKQEVIAAQEEGSV